MKRKTSILGTLTARTFRLSKSRNLVAILAILLTTMMFTTLFTLSQSMGQNMTEMYLRQAGTTAHASTKSILDAEITKIVSHPDVVSRAISSARCGSRPVVGEAKQASA